MVFGIDLRVWLAIPAMVAAVDLVYLDYNYKKIPNNHLLVYLLIAIIGFLIPLGLTLSGRTHPWPPLGPFYLKTLAHVGVASVASIGLWRLGVWPAGDSKLFILLSVWIPLFDPFSPLLPWRLALASLINVFLPAAAFILLKTAWWVWKFKLWGRADFLTQMGVAKWPDYFRESQAKLVKTIREGLVKGRKEHEENPGVLRATVLSGLQMTIAGAAASTWILARVDLSWMPGPLFGFAIYLGFDGVRRAVGDKLTWVLLALALVAGRNISVPGDGTLFLQSWMQWAFFMTMFGVGMYSVRLFLVVSERFLVLFWIGMMFLMMIGPRMVLGYLGYYAPSGALNWAIWGAACGLLYLLVASFLEEDVIHLKLDQLGPYLVLAGSTLDQISEDEEFSEEYFSRIYPDGMLPYQLKALRMWCREHKVKTVAIKKTMPFAVWIFTGAILTVWFRWDVITVMVKGVGNG